MINKHNILCSLLSREYRSNNNIRVNSKIVKELVCQKDAKFTKVWEKHVSQPITYEGGKLYFENYRTCLCVHGIKGLPQKVYKLPSCPTSQKIEDCLIAEYPLENIQDGCERNYRSCLLALTAHNHLLRYDLDTGQLYQDVYLSCRFKFRQLSWDSAGYTFVIRSTHEKISAIARQANLSSTLLMALSIFTIFPLQCVAVMEIDKKIFGRDVTDAMISQGVLIIMHQNNILRFYSLCHIIQQSKQFDVDLGKPHPAGEGLIGSSPYGVPVNIRLSECLPVLFEVRCAEHKLTIGATPWHYIITPKGNHDIFNIHTLHNHKLVKNGELDMGTMSVEPDKCFFHADESGRILHIGANQVRVLALREVNLSSEQCPAQFELYEQFSITATQPQQHVVSSQGDGIMYTSSGRVIKRKKYTDNIAACDTESIQTVDYEEDLDLLVVTKVHQADDDRYKGIICLYDNNTGKLAQEVQLREPWKEFCDHVVAVDMDTIIHIVKQPMRKFIVYVYRLDRAIPSEEETSPSQTHNKRRSILRRTSRRSSSSRSSVSLQEEEVDTSNTRHSNRRTAQRSQSSFR